MILGCLKESMKLSRNGYVCLAVIVCMAASRCAFNQFQYFMQSSSEEVTNTNKAGGSILNGKLCVVDDSIPAVVDIEQKLKKIQYEDPCFCNLQGAINDDCSCQVDAVDQFNNFKVYPRLQSLLLKNYFRYIQVNLKKDCPYWTDDSTCSFEFCQVKPCGENEVPAGIKGRKTLYFKKPSPREEPPKPADCGTEQDLGSINTTLSAESKEGFERWKQHDESLAEFCTVPDDEDDSQAQYVDLLLNPERFTGYGGPSAHRVWSSIYHENCFTDVQSSVMAPFTGPQTEGSCIEKRTFYRAISGLHSSINIHLSAKYLLSENKAGGLFKAKGGGLVWGPNVTEFRQHFETARTAGEAAQWLKNLYFLYLLELRAVAKISGYLQQFDLYTGDSDEDQDVKYAIRDLLRVVEIFPFHFDENALFSGADAGKLKAEFHTRFTNITKIMDCVGCQKCKLWGKVQIKGLGTALKILFADSFAHQRGSFLTRNEIVALFNGFGRLSESIYELNNFRRLLKSDDNHKHRHLPGGADKPKSPTVPKFVFRR